MVEPQTAQRRKAYKVAQDLGLSREERHAFASYLLRRDVETWRSLSEAQIERLLDAMEGIELYCELVRQRPPA